MSAALRPADDAASVHGHVDALEPNGTVRGWCAALAPPFGPRRISILIDGVSAVTGIACDLFRSDLLTANIGDGNHGFVASIPTLLLVSGEAAEVSLLDEASGDFIDRPRLVQWAPRAALQASLEAHIDDVTTEGLVTGWCWDPADPDRRVVLNVLADGLHAATSVAGLYRDDLRTAGKGSGHCGFSCFLPWHQIGARAEIAITLQDSETGLPLGQRAILRRPQIVTAERRIDALERQLRLLRTELQAAEARAAQANDARGVPELFRLIASFFQDLADGRPRSTLATLNARLDEIAEQFPLVSLSVAGAPEVTIFVLPDGRIDRLHACLAALHRAGADTIGRIVVLEQDGAGGEDVTLIQAVVRNAHVLRLRPDETINDALRTSITPFLALLPCHIMVGPGWLERLLAALKADPNLVLAAGALSADGCPAATRRLVADPACGLRAAIDAGSVGTSDPDALIYADAIDELGVVLCAQKLRDLGGLDLSYSSLGAQMLDACLRLRGAGLKIACDPAAVAFAPAGLTSLLDQGSPSDLARLRAGGVACMNRQRTEAAGL